MYAARNAHSGDSVLKIGQTRLSPLQRIDQLSNATVIYEPFELVYFINTTDCHVAEARIHDHLWWFRIDERREFFEIDPCLLRA